MSDTPPPRRPIESQQADPQQEQPHSEYQRDRENERDRLQKEHNDKMMLLVTAVGVFVGIVSIAVGIWFGRDTSENQKHSLDAQIQAMVLEQRPYLRIESAGYHDEQIVRYIGDLASLRLAMIVPVIHIKIKAFGRTPALNIVVKGECEAHAAAQEWMGRIYETEPDFDRPVGFLFPGEDHEMFCGKMFTEFKPSQTIDHVKYRGVVSYQDFSKNSYETSFCFTADVPSGNENSAENECPIVEAPH